MTSQVNPQAQSSLLTTLKLPIRVLRYAWRTIKAGRRLVAIDAAVQDYRHILKAYNERLDSVSNKAHELNNIAQELNSKQQQLSHHFSNYSESFHNFRTQMFDAIDRLEITSNYPHDGTATSSETITESTSAYLDDYYWRFEEHFRGSREQISERLSVYEPFVKEVVAKLPETKAVDIGCGRGEWLDLLSSWGIKGSGVDLNARMIKECQNLGHEVQLSDALAYLKRVPTESLGVVTGFHIVEHLPLNVLVKLFYETFRVLRPGGIVIFETPNPENLLVGSCNFFTDPTHRNPIPPHSLNFLLSYAGFRRQECLRLGGTNPEELPTQSTLATLVQRVHTGPDYSIVGFRE